MKKFFTNFQECQEKYKCVPTKTDKNFAKQNEIACFILSNGGNLLEIKFILKNLKTTKYFTDHRDICQRWLLLDYPKGKKTKDGLVRVF